MPATVEAMVVELRRSRPSWRPRRLVFELAKRRVLPVPSESAVYRALVRAGSIDPRLRDRRSRKWKRWERGAAMELWQRDLVGGFALVDGTSAKAVTGLDDHSRMCVCARLMARERTRAVCDGLRVALATYGAPEQIFTENGKVFTGRFNHPPVEVLLIRSVPSTASSTWRPNREARPRRARSSGSTAACVLNSSANNGLSPTSRPLSRPLSP